MPRALPRYDQEFLRRVAFARNYVAHIEDARSNGIRNGLNTITLVDVEYAYELAYLHIFLAWENLLEDALLRLICGYARSTGPEPLVVGGSYHRTISAAETAILAGRAYRLWHNPIAVIGYAQQFLAGSRYELVIASSVARLTHFASVRHRIAHSQRHAEQQFDVATMSIAGRRYPASRPGRFLRDWVPTSARPRRWMIVLAEELSNLAVQICA